MQFPFRELRSKTMVVNRLDEAIHDSSFNRSNVTDDMVSSPFSFRRPIKEEPTGAESLTNSIITLAEDYKTRPNIQFSTANMQPEIYLKTVGNCTNLVYKYTNYSLAYLILCSIAYLTRPARFRAPVF